MEKQILVRVPGYSSAQIADMLDGLPLKCDDISISTRSNEVDSAMEPATVAVLISAGALILSQVLRSITEIYLDHKKARNPSHSKPNVNVTIFLTLGGKISRKVKRADEFDDILADLPSDPSEVTLVELE